MILHVPQSSLALPPPPHPVPSLRPACLSSTTEVCWSAIYPVEGLAVAAVCEFEFQWGLRHCIRIVAAVKINQSDRDPPPAVATGPAPARSRRSAAPHTPTNPLHSRCCPLVPCLLARWPLCFFHASHRAWPFLMSVSFLGGECGQRARCTVRAVR